MVGDSVEGLGLPEGEAIRVIVVNVRKDIADVDDGGGVGRLGEKPPLYFSDGDR
ncbi:hypothetical protein QJS10_CPA03g01386 [Acorus calamus]|uniref:Uncharacterized protein n=1 Tax=Acorus calamus TaxID=4465 RepID=A0AAV9F528_ACOCL|nr:hypothetical protein QJS10_CPA03g01386 [Acorus calamus]